MIWIFFKRDLFLAFSDKVSPIFVSETIISGENDDDIPLLEDPLPSRMLDVNSNDPDLSEAEGNPIKSQMSKEPKREKLSTP